VGRLPNVVGVDVARSRDDWDVEERLPDVVVVDAGRSLDD